VVSGQWQGWWIYWVGPTAGMLLAVVVCSLLAKRSEVAKLYHFDRAHGCLLRRAGA
jgi:aquaporin Z